MGFKAAAAAVGLVTLAARLVALEKKVAELEAEVQRRVKVL